MECTLAALIACFSWSNLYLDTGVSWQDRGDSYFVTQPEYFERTLQNGVIESGTDLVTRYRNMNRNPYGRFSIGYYIDLGAITLSLEAAHRSSLDSGDDRGINSVSLSARWFPFR